MTIQNQRKSKEKCLIVKKNKELVLFHEEHGTAILKMQENKINCASKI